MQLILLELNEINFDFVQRYLEAGINLPGFKSVIENNFICTTAESEYDKLEPWIQWTSVHTGKTYNDHQVFRLGDIVKSNHEQFFESVESSGFRVGAISPMNAANNLVNPVYFIPDPWTKTPSDQSLFSRSITSAISQAVNDNSQSKLSITTTINLSLAFLTMVNPKRYIPMAKYAIGSRGKPWRKALFLDMLLYEIHKTLFKRKKSEFSTLFLNSGAHIQHHYFFNSPYVHSATLKNPSWYVNESDDPFLEMLRVYDEMLVDLTNLSGTEVIIATGLSQKPYEQLRFYYRLKNHSDFLNEIGVDFTDVAPRMTRDFLIIFDSKESAKLAEKKLSEIIVNDGLRLFEEIDNRGKDLFVVLTYPSEITEETLITLPGRSLSLSKYVTFVAIKNGEHQSKGFAYFSEGISKFAPPQGSHVSKIYNTVLDYFGVPN